MTVTKLCYIVVFKTVTNDLLSNAMNILFKALKIWYDQLSDQPFDQLENVFVKHYAPNHMPDPKGEWSLKENNSELHYGICSKVYQFIYTLVFNYMPIMRIKGVLQISRSKGCSYTKCLYPKKRRVTQLEIYGIGSKVNQFIYTLVWNSLRNIRILAKAVLKIFCSQGCSYTKCL